MLVTSAPAPDLITAFGCTTILNGPTIPISPFKVLIYLPSLFAIAYLLTSTNAGLSAKSVIALNEISTSGEMNIYLADLTVLVSIILEPVIILVSLGHLLLVNSISKFSKSVYVGTAAVSSSTSPVIVAILVAEPAK